MKILAFLPARGGSKGIPNKNLVDLANRPLIKYTLDIISGLGNEVEYFISTDSDAIASYCIKQGFEVPYMRPKELAKDNSLIFEAIINSLDWLKINKKYEPDALLLLQPTSPIRKLKNIKNAIEQFKTQHLSSLVAVSKMSEHPYECIQLDSKGWEYLREPKNKVTCRQEYEDNFYFIDGNFYISTLSFLLENKSFINKGETKFFEVERTVDVDEPEDLLLAESLIRSVKERKKKV